MDPVKKSDPATESHSDTESENRTEVEESQQSMEARWSPLPEFVRHKTYMPPSHFQLCRRNDESISEYAPTDPARRFGMASVTELEPATEVEEIEYSQDPQRTPPSNCVRHKTYMPPSHFQLCRRDDESISEYAPTEPAPRFGMASVTESDSETEVEESEQSMEAQRSPPSTCVRHKTYMPPSHFQLCRDDESSSDYAPNEDIQRFGLDIVTESDSETEPENGTEIEESEQSMKQEAGWSPPAKRHKTYIPPSHFKLCRDDKSISDYAPPKPKNARKRIGALSCEREIPDLSSRKTAQLAKGEKIAGRPRMALSSPGSIGRDHAFMQGKFTPEETKLVFRFIAINNFYPFVKGNLIYKKMEEMRVVQRTADSIRNHVMQIISSRQKLEDVTGVVGAELYTEEILQMPLENGKQPTLSQLENCKI